MGQSVKYYLEYTDNLLENYSEQINSEYFGPHYASQYELKTKFITHFKTCNNKIQEQRKTSQMVCTTNYTDQEIALNSIEKNEKFLINKNQILDYQFDLDSKNVNLSYNNSTNAPKSILKKKDQKTSKPQNSVRFINTDLQIKFSLTQQKQLGQLLKRKRN
ncbi:unnamed protein product [Paramecium sonneborni]|uniref:Uncharacterized protein n=1 Tax=Paramecium sonneborni TaxID=65129 RepID=A0A8S1QV69_9CILI|nr:unnamed protein product [Paramecium sonneborni]